jgi:hypothetical protein
VINLSSNDILASVSKAEIAMMREKLKGEERGGEKSEGEVDKIRSDVKQEDLTC